jgi:hypothetical protein
MPSKIKITFSYHSGDVLHDECKQAFEYEFSKFFHISLQEDIHITSMITGNSDYSLCIYFSKEPYRVDYDKEYGVIYVYSKEVADKNLPVRKLLDDSNTEIIYNKKEGE